MEADYEASAWRRRFKVFLRWRLFFCPAFPLASRVSMLLRRICVEFLCCWRRRESNPMPPFSRNGGDARLSWSTRRRQSGSVPTRCPRESPGVPTSPPQSWRNGGRLRERCPGAGTCGSCTPGRLVWVVGASRCPDGQDGARGRHATACTPGIRGGETAPPLVRVSSGCWPKAAGSRKTQLA